MLKREIEKEFSDLFPKEPTFICAKLEDEYGYSLSNSSVVSELLKNGDRIYAIPEGFSIDDPTLHLSSSLSELLLLLSTIHQNISSKLTLCPSLSSHPNPSEILLALIPLGFSQTKNVLHNVAVGVGKVFEGERLDFLERRENSLVFNLMITMINYWLNDLVPLDSFLLSSLVDILEILCKSAIFCSHFKSPFTLNNLMALTKLEFISAQTRSRLIRLISYLGKGEFRNIYQPRPLSQAQAQYQARRREEEGSRREEKQGIKREEEGSRRKLEGRTGREGEGEGKNENGGRRREENGSRREEEGGRRGEQGLRMKEDERIWREGLGRRRIEEEGRLQPSSSFQEINNRENMIKPSSPLYSPPHHSSYPPPSSTYLPPSSSLPRNVTSNLMGDFIDLLEPSNSREMLVFAMQNLAPAVEAITPGILDSDKRYLKFLNLIEIILPPELQQAQIELLDSVAENLRENRAEDGLKAKVIPRLLKAFSIQNSKFQPVFFKLLRAHLELARSKIDVSTLITLLSSPFLKLQDFAAHMLSQISDPNIANLDNIVIQFENHLPLLLEMSLNKKRSLDFKNSCLLTVANLSLREELRGQIVYNGGVEVMISHLRNKENVEGGRIAAKGLLNLSLKSRELKLKIVTELGDEIRLLQRNQLDEVISGYLQTLLQSKDSRYPN